MATTQISEIKKPRVTIETDTGDAMEVDTREKLQSNVRKTTKAKKKKLKKRSTFSKW